MQISTSRVILIAILIIQFGLGALRIAATPLWAFLL